MGEKTNSWGFIGVVIRSLVVIELLVLGGYGRCMERVSLNTGWWIEDYLSVGLISLTVFVVVISLVASDDDFILENRCGRFVGVVVAVGVICVMFFSCADIFLFFFFFERSLIPTVVLILGWGHQPERLQAGLQMIIYTVCGSLPLLVLLAWIWVTGGRDRMMVLRCVECEFLGNYRIFWFLILLGILVKVPVFLVHGWLPKAHVEAPLSGSMLLAGILLKLGIYGICRVV